jgi:DNA primase
MIDSFDVIEYLDDRGIAYRTEGKNVSYGWAEVNCPFCPDGDPSEHLGIKLESKVISCWRCPTKGTIRKFIQRLERCSYAQVDRILEQFQDRTLSHLPQRRSVSPSAVGSIELPTEASPRFPSLHTNWLRGREFDPDFVVQRYDLYAVNLLGDWRFRIIIPVYQKHRLVTYTSRDVTEMADSTWRSLSNEESIIPPKHCLYNIDSVQDTAIAVEGATDVWRLGAGAVATLGSRWTSQQVALLSGLKNLFVMFDSESLAIEQAYRFAHAASSVVRSVNVIELTEGDPADLSQDTVDNIRREIFGRE